MKALVVLLTALVCLVATAVPASAVLSGVDVSSYQHPGGARIDWGAVRASGQDFAFIKATEGTSYTNPYFSQDWAAAGANGLYRGAYHYARPALPLSTAVDQARYFVSRTGSMTGAADLPGVLDLEETGGLGQGDLANWARTWLGEVQRLTGKSPMVYAGYYFWRDQVGNPADIGAAYRLWLPSYPNDPNSTTFKPLVPAGWSTWTFWQYRSDGSVPGISGGVDMNRFCCDLPTLSLLGGGGGSAGSPFGSLDGVSAGFGGVSVSGWAIDPDSTDPIQVHVYVAGAGTPLGAGQGRGDVAAAYPGFGSNHGFSGFVPTGSGLQQVCAYGINVGGGGNRLLGCRTVEVPSGSPFGTVDSVTGRFGGIDASGWAIDPNTSASIPVHVYVDGVGYAVTANQQRPDVGGAFAGYGNAHGWSLGVNAPPGDHRVCAYGIESAAPGSNSLLGCRTVTVPDGSPIGNLDLAGTAYGLVRVAGWALDPDTSASIPVHVYVNGVGTAFTAADSRPDVDAAFGRGGAHGFDVAVPRVGSGANTVCVYAINVTGTGSNRLIGCRVV